MFGLALIFAAMFLHWFWDSLIGITGGANWANLGAKEVTKLLTADCSSTLFGAEISAPPPGVR